ncbi:MAG TPA: sigma factor-like helix-turn-helix DNA-binding protein [Solirubrobacteraceae bacterium]|nr:sigma factor-like helix-turn-helix DNA-binding protein [Solirubrobacteraceae bacterium]
MSPLDDLPPDLRATLSLLVDRGKSYAEVADLLGIPESAVRERAHAALDALAGEQVATAAGARAGAIDGEQPAARVSSSFAPEDGAGLASEGPPVATSSAPRGAHARRNGAPRGGGAALPVSRRGGAIVLAVIAVVIVVVVVVVVAGGGSDSHKGGASGRSSSASTSGASTTSGKTPQVTNQITLTPPEPGSKAIGLVEILTEGAEHAFYIAAEHLAPSKGFTYVVWLYNSPTSAEAVSKSPNVGSNGRLQGGALLPSNASHFHQILLTRETSERPTSPGPTVLSGTFSLDK